MIDLEEFDPTDANAGMEAAERANRLETVIRRYLELSKENIFSGFEKEFRKALDSHCPCKVHNDAST